jgi:NAD(P)-dependent dehydrogenase (short-subunit alcohol dehydrogenase family)
VEGLLADGVTLLASFELGSLHSIDLQEVIEVLLIAPVIFKVIVADHAAEGVNNAGIFIAKPFTEYTEDDFAAKISVNLAGFFHISQRAVRQMLAQGGGHIVNLTTTLVNQPVKGVPSALASLTKGGLDAVTRSLAIEYADKGIRVNAVAPGVIKTPMHAPDTHAFLAGLHPLGRMGEVREIVEAVLYLESATFVTGETLHVDGGAHAGHW